MAIACSPTRRILHDTVAADLEALAREIEAAAAKSNPVAHRNTRIMARRNATLAFDHVSAGCDASGAAIWFCVSRERNAAGYFLFWRERRTAGDFHRTEFKGIADRGVALALACRRRDQWQQWKDAPCG
jgi:hypothetical protein